MPIPVSIYLTQEADGLSIYDHYNNDKQLVKNANPQPNSTIHLGLVATDNCSFPQVGRLLIKGKVRTGPNKWEARDEAFDVTSGENPWPRMAGLATLINLLLDMRQAGPVVGGAEAKPKSK